MNFAEPRWLWFALIAPAATVALQWYSGRMRRRQLALLAAPEHLQTLTANHSPWRRRFKAALLVLGLAGMGIALARPQWGQLEYAGYLLGQDVVFLIDCSRSMLATDVSPNRLQRSKLAVVDYVQRYGRGRVGLVAFSGQAFLQCPLTFDYSAFQESLLALDEKAIPVAGTDIARALEEGYRAMDKSERLKLLVLITDGEDLEKGGIKKAQELAKEGVVVFTLGVGTPAGAEIQVINEQGKPELLLDSKGQVVVSRLDETTLRAIAEATQGSYFPLGPVGEGLARVRVASESLNTKAGGAAPLRKIGVDRFHVPVAIVIVLLVAESLIGTRRRLRENAV
jgi:Ca-activated chloride channel family protein